ncbi:acetoacetate--CoA ligase [Pelagibacterium halotolerans]|uniref:Acetoacetyl-CoA synthetase n=1 Tax=Pelagibacterium halotolerans (strain DSM 22347 / JCM 15775 / CGMCC 1.7692 / B2) TaxID=1082931 RepID=G4R7M1_PELHB|nr:acetoacetate--CoA ligase [Pelagibacterium halotolerans]AEQ52325.1 acetoacetyl-CoA synthetase [Pelagibacterium halotolerans B2]QJR17934.1 acetoacetate--CoA ligase [Pelagibacterium halotolerans]SEA33322.1 acetoacetyl-CoA synthetase [Pelagibacterium halotolerans]
MPGFNDAGIGEIVWEADASRKEGSALWRFAEATRHSHGADPSDYAALLDWSIREPEAFHDALWDFLGVVGDKGETAFVAGETIRDAKFYPGARLNYAENLLTRRDDGVAIIAHRDDGTRREMSCRALYDRVSQVEQALRAEGVVEGDRVAAIVTHDIEAIVFYLATSAIGAIWSSCSPDFGPAGASDRLGQIDPKILVAVPNYGYAGKSIDVSATIRAVAEATKLKKIVLLGAVSDGLADLGGVAFEDWIAPIAPQEIAFNRMEFSAPLAILYSSGTTGKPKCIVHSGAGLLIQHKKEQMLHCDIREGERLFYFTTCGWMMWNWQVSGLALGATLVTYDGNPFYPEPGRLIDLIDEDGIAIFGTSAKYIDACAKAGLKPKDTHRLSQLRLILSTGSPLIAPSFDYVYADWKSDVHLASISGGTDICACFIGGNPLLPVRRGELQCAMLGMDLDTLDDEGRPVSGVPGEFVCRNTHVSMPVSFWGDADGSRYTEAYFARFPGIWAHGDFVEKRPSGGFIIHGRSDTTLNPGGVRIGTAEIYRQVETIAAVEEAIAVGQDFDGDQRVVLFVKLRDGQALDAALEKEIRTRIRSGASPRHVPARIIAVTAIPRTRSGKISEIAVRDVIHGRAVKNTTALANPDALELYRDIEALRE